ncbi:hypothetical protein [Spirosoma arcticum]
MALINLTLISEVVMQALHLSFSNHRDYFNWPQDAEHRHDQHTYQLLKTYEQGSNLQKQLVRVHKVCSDFSAGNVQPYIDEHLEYCHPEDDPFDPFHIMQFPFVSNDIHNLPPAIEQYAELVILARGFTTIKRAQDEAFEQFFGGLTKYYVGTDEAGEKVMVPTTDMPEEFIHQSDINRQIKHVEVEYCLDGYNDFYAQALALIEAHRPLGDAKECAAKILALFAPWEAKTDQGNG